MSEYPSTVSQDDIRYGFMDYGVMGANFQKGQYALIDPEWLEHKFPPSLKAFRERMLTHPDYDEKSNLCRHFVTDAIYWASVLHRNTRQDSLLAIGRCYYKPIDMITGHAICVAACREGKEIIPVWFDPQPMEIVKLEWEEVTSAVIEFVI